MSANIYTYIIKDVKVSIKTMVSKDMIENEVIKVTQHENINQAYLIEAIEALEDNLIKANIEYEIFIDSDSDKDNQINFDVECVNTKPKGIDHNNYIGKPLKELVNDLFSYAINFYRVDGKSLLNLYKDENYLNKIIKEISDVNGDCTYTITLKSELRVLKF